jgi:spore maturation protein CgeB
MKILCCFGQHQYGDPTRGTSLEYAAFVPALARLGHEVKLFDSWNRTRYTSLAELNQALLDAVNTYRPDVFFSVHMECELWLETLLTLRARGDVAMVSWAADDSWKYRQVSRFIGKAYHAMATTYDYRVADYVRDCIPHVILTQWAASNADLAPPLPAASCTYPVSFIGAAHGTRRQWIDQLGAMGIEVKCFGHGWPAGSVEASAIPSLMRQSVISLNFANSRGRDQIKARTFEVPGAGGFLLTGYVDGLERYYTPGEEIATFHNLKELAARIRHFLDHPAERDAIAWAGYRRTSREHTYEHRLEPLLDYALSARQAAVAMAPVPAMPILERRHRLTAPLKFLRTLLIGLGSLLFGQARGRRAARRLIFELSWRLAGQHTFTAAGWPGRMFPHE